MYNKKNYQKISMIEDNTPAAFAKGVDPDAPMRKGHDSGINVDDIDDD
jgi:hypothetical protein